MGSMKTTLSAALLLLASTLLLFAVLSVPSPVRAAPPRPVPVATAEAPREIAAMLALLRASPCRFERNGRWYDGARAADHLQRKLDYAVGRGMAGSAEAFIDLAATRSSFSGRPYRVQCGDVPPVPARDWFLAVLADLRTPDVPPEK